VRRWMLALGLWAALGCSGMGEKLLELSGTEVAVGEDAVHPADFPLPPPERGEIVTSMKMGLAGTKTETVQYKLPAGTDGDAVLAEYEEHLKTQGYDVQRADQQGTKALTAQVPGGAMLTVGLTATEGDLVLSLVAISKE
jgi:hypothetical protein